LNRLLPKPSIRSSKAARNTIDQAAIYHSLVAFDLEKSGVGPGLAERWAMADNGLCPSKRSSTRTSSVAASANELDVSIRAQMMNLLKHIQAQGNVAYLLVAHDLATVRHMTDQTVVMYLGKIVEHAPTAPTAEGLLELADSAADPSAREKRGAIAWLLPSCGADSGGSAKESVDERAQAEQIIKPAEIVGNVGSWRADLRRLRIPISPGNRNERAGTVRQDHENQTHAAAPNAVNYRKRSALKWVPLARNHH
jgi:hypothetical protein